jgi:hypothetical protein
VTDERPFVTIGSGENAEELGRRAAERAHDRAKEFELQLMEASTRDAQEAMKVALAINGGAAIAVLAFVGTLGSRSHDTLMKLIPVTYSLFCFAAGVFSAAMTAACAYFANSYYSGSQRSAQHPCARLAARVRGRPRRRRDRAGELAFRTRAGATAGLMPPQCITRKRLAGKSLPFDRARGF